MDPQREWTSQVEHALQVYLGCLASDPQLLRTLFIEILHLGQPGLAVRRQMYQELADFIVQVVAATPRQGMGQTIAVATLAMAIVGGINELVLKAIEDDRCASTCCTTAAPASASVRRELPCCQARADYGLERRQSPPKRAFAVGASLTWRWAPRPAPPRRRSP